MYWISGSGLLWVARNFSSESMASRRRSSLASEANITALMYWSWADAGFERRFSFDHLHRFLLALRVAAYQIHRGQLPARHGLLGIVGVDRAVEETVQLRLALGGLIVADIEGGGALGDRGVLRRAGDGQLVLLSGFVVLPQHFVALRQRGGGLRRGRAAAWPARGSARPCRFGRSARKTGSAPPRSRPRRFSA